MINRVSRGRCISFWVTACCNSSRFPSSSRQSAFKDSGELDRNLWLLSQAFSMKDACRQGTLWLRHSYEHKDFWQELESFDTDPSSDEVVSAWKAPLSQALAKAAQQTARALEDTSELTLRNGRLHLPHDGKLPKSLAEETLRDHFDQHLPRIRIESLLEEVQSATGFLDGFGRGSGRQRAALLAALIAQGTNLGLHAMTMSAEGVSEQALRDIARTALTQENIEEANRILLDAHAELPLTAVWGDGTGSSSDGQRFRVARSMLLATYYPRYFGYHVKALDLYTHLSDTFGVTYQKIIACSEREAPYVLEGLIQNRARPFKTEHHTDTHGFSEHLFALCYLLGYAFMPRIANLSKQQLTWLSGEPLPEALLDLRVKRIRAKAIESQWSDLQSLAQALRQGAIPVSTFIKRLQNQNQTHPLAKALTALGQLEKTRYILSYMSQASLRRQVQRMLNRGEQRHQLAKHVFFARQGEFQTSNYDEIMNKASTLSLLSNAIVYWNTVEMQKLLPEFRRQGLNVDKTVLQGVYPLRHRGLIMTGTYRFTGVEAESQSQGGETAGKHLA